jgi:hypothetical protein
LRRSNEDWASDRNAAIRIESSHSAATWRACLICSLIGPRAQQ